MSSRPSQAWLRSFGEGFFAMILPNLGQLFRMEFHLADFSGFSIFGLHHVKLAGIEGPEKPNIKVRFSFVYEHIANSAAVAVQPVSRNKLALLEIDVILALLKHEQCSTSHSRTSWPTAFDETEHRFSLAVVIYVDDHQLIFVVVLFNIPAQRRHPLFWVGEVLWS